MARPPINNTRSNIVHKGTVPISGSQPRMRPRASIPTNQADTSTNLEQIIGPNTNPTPFMYEEQVANIPAPSVRDSERGESWEVVSSPADIRTRSMGKNIPLEDTDQIDWAAVGYEAGDTRKGRNPIISGFRLGKGGKVAGNKIPGKRGR